MNVWSSFTAIKDMVGSFDSVISSALGSVTDMFTLFDSITNLTKPIENIEATVVAGSLTVGDIEQYRWAAGVIYKKLYTCVCSIIINFDIVLPKLRLRLVYVTVCWATQQIFQTTVWKNGILCSASTLILPHCVDRWMGGVGLTCFVLLILVLQLVGLILGCMSCCCCGGDKALPTERGMAGNCAGILLMAWVAI